VGGDAANFYAKVETESGVVLGTYNNGQGQNILPLHSRSSYESVYFKCPTEADVATLASNGNVRLVTYQSTTTNAPSMTMDDFHLGALIGLVETILPDTFSAKVSAAGVVSDENVDFINGNCALSTSTFTCSYNAGIFNTAPNCTVSTPAQSYYIFNTNNLANVQVTTQSSGGILTAQPFTISCQKSGSDAKQGVQVYKSIPKVSQNENVFSAQVSSTGVVNTENVDFINGNCTSAQPSVCTFNSGVFTTTPSCIAIPLGSTQITFSNIPTISASSVSVMNSSNASSQAVAYNLICQKQGADYKLPTVQPIVIGQVTNSAAESGLTNVRTESCRVNNSGTATLDTANSLCAGWVQSVSRTSAGAVAWTLISGIFSQQPVCVASGIGGLIMAFSVTVSSTTVINTTTANGSLAATDGNLYIVCQGKR
jgi:hypothetical protein